jgi:hypothetical protein
VEWSEGHQAWRFCVLSKPESSRLYAVNKEARDEFLLFYEAISLTATSTPAQTQVLVGALPPSSFKCFFNFDTDTLYLTASPGARFPFDYGRPTHLNPAFLQKVKSSAVQGVEISGQLFSLGPPYDASNTDVIGTAGRLARILSTMPVLQTLAVVIGDDYSWAELFTPNPIKRQGALRLMELTLGQRLQPRGAKEWMDKWMQALATYLPENLRSQIHVKQATRGCILGFVNLLGTLTDSEKASLG